MIIGDKGPCDLPKEILKGAGRGKTETLFLAAKKG